MTYGLIMSAGKQSRFERDLPKALVEYNGTTLLDANIKNMLKYCDEVFVICSTENKHWFSGYDRIVIDSGKGCGDAVMQALEILYDRNILWLDDTVFIQWGDCLHDPHVYEIVKDSYTSCCVIPCVFEESPYVQIVPKDGDKVEVKFSKYGEPITKGLHDLSLFYGNGYDLLVHLKKFARMIEVDGSYVHPHGNEMVFLDVFNETDLKAFPLVINGYKSFSFNTLEEFNSIMNSKVDNF